MATATVAALTGRGYLDDAAFARHWVEVRATRGFGAARLRAELRSRGVASALIDAALAALAPAGVLAWCRQAAHRRLAALKRTRPERADVRLRDYLLRRGFPAGVVARVLREVTGRVDENDD